MDNEHGRYKLLSKIGSGGMSEVYKAYDTELDRAVAIKFLKKQFTENADFVDRFKKEAKIIAKINHPNVVSVYDVGIGNDLFIVMELIDGITLKDYITMNKNIPEDKAISIIREVAQGLAAAHQTGIVHRDIKPQNIFISKNGEVKVGDFGIACSVQMSSTGTIVGTAAYMSPEQLGGHAIDRRSDIYSLGVLFYELLTGKLPFENESPTQTVLHAHREMPREIPELNTWLADIICKCTETDPVNRYQTIEEFLIDLDAPVKNTGSKIALIAIIVGVVILLAACLAVFAMFKSSDEEEPTTEIESEANIVTMPNLYGLTEEAAVEKLETLGLVVLTEYTEDEADAGTVIDQDPAAHEEFESGTEVTITVSSGPTTSTLDDYMGQKEATAASMLAALGYNVEIEYEYDDDVNEGYVITTSPEAGSSVADGDTVTIIVSLGPSTVYCTVPDCTGMDEADAVDAIEDAGLKAEVQYTEDNDNIGIVIRQTIAADTSVQEGTTITIWVGEEEETETTTVAMVTVPDLEGLSETDALNMCQKKGLETLIVETQVSGGAYTVYAQSIDAGESVEEGTTIKIFVYVPLDDETEE